MATSLASLEPDIIVYGGTFDPPHLGHLYCIRAALGFFSQSCIFVMLSPQPAAADNVGKNVTTGAEHRLEMVKQLLMQLTESEARRVEIRTDEFALAQPNYTIETLLHLRKLYPSERLALLIGYDQFLSFAKWRRARDICGLASLVVCNRLAESEQQDVSFDDAAKTLGEALDYRIAKASYEEHASAWKLEENGNFWQFLGGGNFDVASREIRKRILAREDVSQMTTPAIIKYILVNHLYGGEEA